MKLRGRISFHFLIQFVILFTVSFLVIIGLLILLVNFITNEELKTNPKESVIENTPTLVVISDGEVSIDDKWKKQLKESHMRLQIINKQGVVIHEENTSPDLEASYNTNELIEMEETNQLNEYTVKFYYDEWLEDSYYFL